MTVFKINHFYNQNRGASVIEVLLAMAIVAVATPFVYSQINRATDTLRDITYAKSIMATRDSALNFVRLNQDKWPDIAQIKLDDAELDNISVDASNGFIDKYGVSGAVITDVYLSFDLGMSRLRANRIARHIGTDAAVVDTDGVAYGNTWAVAAPEFKTGDLVYRISRDIVGEDTSKYLHRATSGQDDLNVMLRDLNMGRHHVYDVATVSAESANVRNVSTDFLDSKMVDATTIYFSAGANLNGEGVNINNLRVSDDTYGFRNIYAKSLNGSGYSVQGSIVTDRATVLSSVNVAKDMVLKSDGTRTISGFTGITTNSVYAPFLSAQEIRFYENFGLTISGELLMSTTAPLRIGGWSFPSLKPPKLNNFNLSRGARPDMPSKNDFGKITGDGWQYIQPITTGVGK